MLLEYKTQILNKLKIGENAVITKTIETLLPGFFHDSLTLLSLWGQNLRYHGNLPFAPKLRLDFRFFSSSFLSETTFIPESVAVHAHCGSGELHS